MAKNGAKAVETASTDSIEDKDWEEFKRQVRGTVSLLGGLIFMPFILFLGLMHGIRAGIIATLKETLKMLKTWDV